MPDAQRILIVNPNTSQEVTDAYLAQARRIAPDHVILEGVTGTFGARIVSTAAENIIAGHSALDLVATRWKGHDAIILAISFDTALSAIRPLVPVPVIGITEAAITAADADRHAVGIICFGEVSLGLYSDLIARYGLDPIGFETISIASAADYLSPKAQDRAVLDAVARLAQKGATAVVICGTAIVGMAKRLQDLAPVPLFDGSAAIRLALSATDRARSAPPALAPVGDTVGLSRSLAALLRGEALER